MRRYGKRWLGAAVAIAILAVSSGAGAAEDDAVRAAALAYAEAWATGDAERMAGALHPDAVRRRVVVDLLSREPRLQTMHARDLVSATQDGAGRDPGPGPLNLRVAILDRHGAMATARVVSALYVEYLHMVRWDDRWVVLDVLWGTVASPGE
jgi:hypothetical protein